MKILKIINISKYLKFFENFTKLGIRCIVTEINLRNFEKMLRNCLKKFSNLPQATNFFKLRNPTQHFINFYHSWTRYLLRRHATISNNSTPHLIALILNHSSVQLHNPEINTVNRRVIVHQLLHIFYPYT